MATTTKKHLRFAIVGIGFGQAVLVPALRRVPECEPTLLCASDRIRARAVADRLGVAEASGDWRAVAAAPDIDAVCVAVPPALQPDIAVACLEAGKAVFCEKPLAPDAAGAARIADAARASSVPCMTDFVFPEIPVWRTARSILREGRIGALRHLHVAWQVETYANRLGLASWKTDPAQGGGALCAFVSHTLHALEWFAGPIARIEARLHKSPRDERPGETLVLLQALLREGGAASVVVGTDAPGGSGHRVELYGDQGSLRLGNPGGDYINGFSLAAARRTGDAPAQEWDEAGLNHGMDGWRSGPDGPLDGRQTAAASLLHTFANWIRSGEPAAPSAEHGLRVQHLIEAARRSHDIGAWVEVPPPRVPSAF
ncbi:MAG: Gfo/Idh/MocA family protein [Desulfovibrionaceae bacterium]